MRLAATIALCAALAFSSSAVAQPAAPSANTPDLERDINCLAIGFVLLANANNETSRTQASTAVYYFLGRVDGALPPAQFDARLTAAVTRLSTAPDRGAIAQRCSRLLIDRGQSLMRLGERMSADGR